jgi:hypothetical protein
MKKLYQVGASALIAVVFSAAMLINVNSAKAEDPDPDANPGTGTGTGTAASGKYAPRDQGSYDDDMKWVSTGTCCGNGTTTCTPVNCLP